MSKEIDAMAVERFVAVAKAIKEEQKRCLKLIGIEVAYVCDLLPIEGPNGRRDCLLKTEKRIIARINRQKE